MLSQLNYIYSVLTTTQESVMQILITAQHLDGNDPDGFNTAAWLDALTNSMPSL